MCKEIRFPLMSGFHTTVLYDSELSNETIFRNMVEYQAELNRYDQYKIDVEATAAIMGVKMRRGQVPVYLNGTDFSEYSSAGRYDKKTLKEWKEFGTEHGQRVMYRAYRWRYPNAMKNNRKVNVVIFDKYGWSDNEKDRRKSNGLLGLKEYKFYEEA